VGLCRTAPMNQLQHPHSDSEVRWPDSYRKSYSSRKRVYELDKLTEIKIFHATCCKVYKETYPLSRSASVISIFWRHEEKEDSRDHWCPCAKDTFRYGVGI
jgi:hypothetical protein